MRPEERERYRLHGKLPVHRRRVEAAKAIVRQAVDAVAGTWAVGCSGGKDSTALLSVVVETGWVGPVFHFWSDETPVENSALVAALADRFGLTLLTTRVRGDWDLFGEMGHAFVVPDTMAEAAAWHRAGRDYKADAEAGAAQAGLAGLFWGLRGEESRARRILCAKRGPLYRAAGRREWTALPLARWTARDVWARHLSHGLSWLRRYDAADDRERERSEPVWLGFAEPWARGQGADIRRTDPALWARLTDRWPELRRWG